MENRSQAEMNPSSDSEELDPSVLGKKDYWDQFYTTEIENFSATKDEGEKWFGESCERRIVRFLLGFAIVQPATSCILDIGCGNGSFLRSLAEHHFEHLTGIDYSPAAINLAKSIGLESNCGSVAFKVCDILSSDDSLGQFDVLHDKGTYDAISLMENSREARRLYLQFVSSHCILNGILVLTSCNWTKDELLQQFNNGFCLLAEIPAPQMSFGGSQGSTVTSLVFRKT